MDSDHSESEFYYPDEVEKFSDKENIGSQQKKKPTNAQFTMASGQKYILTQRPENTVKKSEYDLHVCKRFFLEVGETRKIEEIPADELNILICQFLIEIKKKDGGSYEPATLQSFQRSLQRYLNDKKSKLNVLEDLEFLKSREVLLSKKKQLVFEEAKGNRPHAAKELSNAEEDLLFRTGEFGAESPEALQRNSLVVIGTALWIPCTRRKQETKMGRNCPSNRQRNGQGISDLEIRKRIQDPPRQW